MTDLPASILWQRLRWHACDPALTGGIDLVGDGEPTDDHRYRVTVSHRPGAERPWTVAVCSRHGDAVWSRVGATPEDAAHDLRDSMMRAEHMSGYLTLAERLARTEAA